MPHNFITITGLGQDSHRFYPEGSEHNSGSITLAACKIPYQRSLMAESDGDVVLHAVTNAISSVTTKPILGAEADRLCEQGIQDSLEYLKLGFRDLEQKEMQLQHLAISIEAKAPKLLGHIPRIQESLAKICGLKPENIGITATSGEGLTECGRGEGIQVFCVASFLQKVV